MHEQLLISFFVALLAITNPIGNLALFIGFVSKLPLKQQRRQAAIAAVSIFIILTLVVWLGDEILKFFGIGDAAFVTAGALIIILMGISMLRNHDGKGHSNIHHDEKEHGEAETMPSVAVVPIAIPIVAGPGAITTVIVHSHQLTTVTDHLLMNLVCLLISIIMYICFYFAAPVGKFLGAVGIGIATRIMGLILTAIAFQMLGTGLRALLPGLA